MMLSGPTRSLLYSSMLALQAVKGLAKEAVKTPTASRESKPAEVEVTSIMAPPSPEAAGGVSCTLCAAHATALTSCTCFMYFSAATEFQSSSVREDIYFAGTPSLGML